MILNRIRQLIMQTFFSYSLLPENTRFIIVRKKPYTYTSFDIRQSDSTGGAAPDMECLFYIPRKTFGKRWIFESHICKAIYYNNLCVGGPWITWLFWNVFTVLIFNFKNNSGCFPDWCCFHRGCFLVNLYQRCL